MLGNCIMRNPSRIDGKLDKGAICESLLFFGKAHLIIDYATLASIVHAGFLDELIVMLKAGYLTANYSPQSAVLYSDSQAGLRQHLFTVIKVAGDQKRRMLRNPEILKTQLGRLIDDKAKIRAYHRELCGLISFEDFDGTPMSKLGVRDISDPFIASQVAKMALRHYGVPDEELVFSRIDVLSLNDGRFVISTDIDFDKLRRFVPEGDRATFGENHLFPAIADARLDIQIAAEHNAAFVGNERNQTIIDMILRRSIGTRFDSERPIRQIYDFISVDTPSLRDVINSGERTPSEFVRLMEKARPFQEWLKEQIPTADLVKEMLREKSKVDWIESLPIKALRFGLFVGSGKLADAWAPGMSVVAEGVDTFVVESLAKRWRPHYFVENNLRGFLDRN